MSAANTIDNQTSLPSQGLKFPISLFTALSWYPFIWAISILIVGLLKSPWLLFPIMAIWMVYVYVGSLVWIFLVFYLPIKKKITWSKLLLNILILVSGIALALVVAHYDITNSGITTFD